ncbi:lysophospholipid acyltransferase family protein [Arcobacter lacus]|uniref:lysophospholipid acyltransferase family protein n=1 Tax=Arcobacter lacus TaxID=1912876 RepID=UPI0021BAF9DF|nr:lysophospholipid acyltransferase family protein [Arcobacter lacus]MCT7911462.1 lysophospholipid acyltransferase family protein [Arcobacter lacus]
MFRYFKLNILPHLLYYLVKLIYATNKKVYHHPKSDNKEAMIICMWHGDLMSQPYNYFAFRKDGIVKAMISHNKDGEIITKLVSNFKIGAVRGSTSKGAAKVMISAIKELKDGNDIAITPDGPRGPRYSIADGIVAIAQKSGKNIVCFNTIPTKYWQFNSWDKFILPKPFGRIDFYISEPYDIKDMEFEEAKVFIKEKMLIHSIA